MTFDRAATWLLVAAGFTVTWGATIAHAQSLTAPRGALRVEASGGGLAPGAYPSLRRELSFDTPTQGLRLQRERFGLLGGTAGSDPTTTDDTAQSLRFDDYRMTWRYALVEQPSWTWRIGITGFVRDGRHAQRPGLGRSQSPDASLGPMLHAYGAWRPTERWSLVAEVDGMGLSDRRVWDLGLSARYEFAPNWHAGFGYRLLDSGIEARQWQNLGRFSGATLSVGYRF